MTTHQTKTLTWNIFVAPAGPIASDNVAPGQSRRTWSPISATLISGERDAVLVDPLMTLKQGHALADWVAATGKNLTTVYITHGHGDHWFGLSVIRERFPHVRAVAVTKVVEYMRLQASPESLARFWNPLFPGQIPQGVAGAEPLEGSSFELEGNELIAIEVGHTDTDNTTVLHVPAIGLVVAGDVAYNSGPATAASTMSSRSASAVLATVQQRQRNVSTDHGNFECRVCRGAESPHSRQHAE